MKKLFVFLLSFVLLTAADAQPLNVMSFNIRLNIDSDSLNAWPHRKDFAASQILFHEAHIVGVQEALHVQMTDLSERLKNYKSVGGGRNDGKTKGEYSAIFYDTTRLQVLKTETFWLSQTPTVPGSKGWDAAITRVVTWAQLRDKKTGKTSYAFNTHFDHMGKVARAESARLLKQRVKEVAGNSPVVITGDFNSAPTEEPIRILLSAPDAFTDAKSVSATPHYGPTGTFTGFQPKETGNEPIDYIFIKNGFKVLKHAALSQTWGGRFSSDHFPVLAVLQW